MSSYVSDLSKHNHSDALTMTSHVSIPESIACILRYLKGVFYTGLKFSAQDVNILCNTHTLKFPMKDYTTDIINKVYWFYIHLRVYIRHDTFNITDLTCTISGVSYIDRLVLFSQHYSIPFDTAIKCITDIHNFIHDCSEIKKLITRSETAVTIVSQDTPQIKKQTVQMSQMKLTKTSTSDTHVVNCILASLQLHNEVTTQKHAENTPAGEYYAQFISGKITEQRFFDIMNAMCVIDIYKYIPSTQRVTPEFLLEYNNAVRLIDTLSEL